MTSVTSRYISLTFADAIALYAELGQAFESDASDTQRKAARDAWMRAHMEFECAVALAAEAANVQPSEPDEGLEPMRQQFDGLAEANRRLVEHVRRANRFRI